ncbi:MFS transporter [Flavobacterium poyangense]|uniref:MFS transporter n=1 Tax=Flavobacterium poyangense TaxID=2204302 RepID=UPI00141FDA54|nr:MFS transporter [Flavobacterium sp. JXAS1]
MPPKSTSPSSPFSVITTITLIFFLWGFTIGENILFIPLLKAKFSLTNFQSHLVDFSFYVAYLFGSLLYLLIAIKRFSWLENFGSRKVMITGLLLSAIGTFCLVIATNTNSYLLLVSSFFTLALGFSTQQIVAHPLILKLGDELHSTSRLLLASGFHAFGITITPPIVNSFIFDKISGSDLIISLSYLQPIYMTITCLYLFFAVCFYIMKLPPNEKTTKNTISTGSVLQYPQLQMGMIAVFCCAGSETSLQNNLPALIGSSKILNLQVKDAMHYFSLFGGSLMIGRWTAAAYNFNFTKYISTLFLFLSPVVAFCILLLANGLNGTDLTQIIDYLPFIFILPFVLLLSGKSPEKMLLYASISSIALIYCSFFFTGKIGMYCIIAEANFSGLMWSCIFIISTKGLGKHMQQGAALLLMMVLGGVLIPPLQGLMLDEDSIGTRNSFFLPIFFLLYVAVFAASRLPKKQPLTI